MVNDFTLICYRVPTSAASSTMTIAGFNERKRSLFLAAPVVVAAIISISLITYRELESAPQQ